jgi:sirohydrochlorin ferrochelatase
VAPDRGFLGNEEARDAFEAFAAGRNAALVFATDERTKASLDAGLESLLAAGAQRVVVLPFFLSRSDARARRVEALLAGDARPRARIEWGRAYGESYLAVESLAERLRGLEATGGRRLIVVGAGARGVAPGPELLGDFLRLAESAAQGLGFESVRVVVEGERERLRAAMADAAAGGLRPVVVPFHQGSKLDGMMSFTGLVRGAAPGEAEVLEGDVTPDPAVVQWLQREAQRALPVEAKDVGVVALAHGSDYHWNETMREALAPLGRLYKVEPAFSMADPQVIERAVRRLEARGARVIVVLRIFGLEASFKQDVERLIGLDVENGSAAAAGHAGHAMDHGHGGPRRPPARIRCSALITTVGGLEDHPLFASTLLERARALSREPGRETVVLVAHGEGDDARDAHWREMLASLAARMRTEGGSAFRVIRVGTWREDWPDKRTAAAEAVRRYVKEAADRGGRALVIPARTLGQGPERRLLQGLSFELGEGFAPHPLFARWAEEMVRSALGAVGPDRVASAAPEPRAEASAR